MPMWVTWSEVFQWTSHWVSCTSPDLQYDIIPWEPNAQTEHDVHHTRPSSVVTLATSPSAGQQFCISLIISLLPGLKGVSFSFLVPWNNASYQQCTCYGLSSVVQQTRLAPPSVLTRKWQHELLRMYQTFNYHVYFWTVFFFKCLYIYVAVPGRNRTLFHCVIRPCYPIWSAVVQNFC